MGTICDDIRRFSAQSVGQFDSIQLKLMSNEDGAGAGRRENSSRAIIYKEYFEFLRGCGTEEQFFFLFIEKHKIDTIQAI